MSSITDYIANLPKPDCAVSVNGNYLEDTVRGYRTSSVSGRNAISMEITETTIGNSNGARYQRKRDESRDLTVSFALVGEHEGDVHMLSRLLQKTLNEPESKFIFADEPTMYWIGTVSDFTEEWQNGAGSDYKAMTGEFTIHCSDPYRHSTTDKTITTNGLTGANTIQLSNDGSAPTPLYIEAYMWGGTKYLAYSLDKDTTTSLYYLMGTLTNVSDSSSSSTAPVTVLNTSFTSDPSWNKNAGIVPPLSTTCEQTGTLEYTSDGAKVTDWGSGSYWHGPSLGHIVPATDGAYPTNWRSTYGLFFDDGYNQANSRGLNAMVYADGSGNPLVTVAFIDQKDDQNTEVVAYINRTEYAIGTIPQNGYHIVNGGNVTVDKVDTDVHIMVSYPKAGSTNTVQYNSKEGSDDPTDFSLSASYSDPSGVKIELTGEIWCKKTDYSSRVATVEWWAKADQYGEYAGNDQWNSAIVDIWINETIVCTEHIPLKHALQTSITWNVWKSGEREFNIPFDASGSAEAKVKIAIRTGWSPISSSPTTTSLTYDCGKIEAGQVNASSYENYNFDKHLTMTNPDVTLRQVSWYTAAYGDDYSSSSSSSSGYRRFKNSILKSFNLIKYNDAKTIAKENQVYFATGDTITIDADKNEARQNGTKNLNIIDITSEPLMLYPGTHNLKVAVDYNTAQHPPTMIITYKERWK